MTSEEEKTVCVTGASGYFASWIVKLLLLCGYTVKASVRNPSAKERLQLFKANLLEEGSFDSAIDGCQGVFHTASPFYHDVKDPQAELLDPATPSVKRVVLTSSIASVAFNGMPRTPETIVDETWFADLEYCRAAKLWYVLSNTLAENAAWKFAKENDLQLVWINAEMVIGPLLQPTLNTSAA
ncbi:hypothetical protein HID58_070458, partial [Brassica napus]